MISRASKCPLENPWNLHVVFVVILHFYLGQSTHQKFMFGLVLVFVIPLIFAFLMEQWMLHLCRDPP